MEHLSYEEMLRELELFRLGKTRFWVDLIVVFQCLKGTFVRRMGQTFQLRQHKGF